MEAIIHSDVVQFVQELNEFTDDARSGLACLQTRTVSVRDIIRIAAQSFRVAADKLDQVWWDCKIAHAAGTTGGIISSCLGLAGVTVVTGGAATPLLLAGLGFGVGGALTNLGTSCVEASINSSEIKKAERHWQRAIDGINDLTTEVQKWLDRKEEVRIAYIYYLAVAFEFLDPILQNLFQQLLSITLEIPSLVMEKLAALGGEGIALLADGTTRAGKTGLQMTDDITQAGKAGLQASDDVAQTSAKTGSTSAGKSAGKVLIAVNVAFLVVDCIDLGFTVRDLVKNKGSEAAKELRRKAEQLEDFLRE